MNYNYNDSAMSSESKESKLRNHLSSIILYLLILVFLIGFNFTDSPPPFGWYQQFMPNLGGKQILDITFLDSLTGYAVASQTTDSSYILKTTNGGDNWMIIHRQLFAMTRLQFFNIDTGYACGGYLYKTTDGGFNWSQINTPAISAYDMSILNKDTIWLIDPNGLVGGVFITTNGGVNWTQQLTLGSLNPDHIYMFNSFIGFVGRTNSYTRMTTNGGQIWFVVDSGSGSGFNNMFLIDSFTGWKSPPMKKTSNGGLNWIEQTLPYGGNLIPEGTTLSAINRDTIWVGGGYKFFPGQGNRATLNYTSNGGNTWYFQLPDTSYGIADLPFIQFSNKLNGWAYAVLPRGIHTVTGGDTVWYMGIVQKSKDIPRNFVLKQNYPNPFNPRTVIPYSLKSPAYVRLVAYDIIGREVQRLVDQKQTAGEYEVDFMGKFISSGVYLYRMQVTDEKGNATFSDTKKMILIK